MTDVILRISGMDCGACAVRIVRALRGLPGLREVSVSDTAGCARRPCARRSRRGSSGRRRASPRCSSFWPPGVGAVWFFRRQPGDLARALTCACGVLAAACLSAAGQAAGVAALAGVGRAAERGELLTRGAEASAGQTARTVRRGIWLLLAYHVVCLPLAACGVIGPAAAAVLACGASGGVLLYALRRKATKGERP